jgi:alkaline phosphatase D
VFAIDLRTYRGPNTANRQAAAGADAAHAGARQLAWLKRALSASRAAWKVIASDLPIGLVVRDGPAIFEGIANAEPGNPLGRELEIADLLRYIGRSAFATSSGSPVMCTMPPRTTIRSAQSFMT